MHAENITTNRLVIVDENNKPRISLTAENGQPTVQLLDGKGNARMALLLSDGGIPVITLAGANGEPRAVLGVSGDLDCGNLIFCDANGDPVAIITDENALARAGGKVPEKAF